MPSPAVVPNADCASPDLSWSDVQARRAAADGRAVFAVRTTGIYCRPTCPARRPRRENVTFHHDWIAAEAAGFRACKRCDPRDIKPAAAVIAELCRRIDAAEALPPLDQMAAEAGYSRFHFHRLFVDHTGLTPRQYAAGRRAERLRSSLAAGAPVTAALYDAGYNAPSRFYAEAPAILGMPAAAARRGGAGEHIRFATTATELGILLAAASSTGLCAIELGDSVDALVAALRHRFTAAILTEQPELCGLMSQVVALVADGAATADLPLDLRGTVFQRRVWQALRQIAPGARISYAALAARIEAPGSARAVAGACAANTLAVVIPCHRVIRGDGSPAGYRWGIARKQALLQREQGAVDRR